MQFLIFGITPENFRFYSYDDFETRFKIQNLKNVLVYQNFDLKQKIYLMY